jgi:hypothetical protein
VRYIIGFVLLAIVSAVGVAATCEGGDPFNPPPGQSVPEPPAWVSEPTPYSLDPETVTDPVPPGYSSWTEFVEDMKEVRDGEGGAGAAAAAAAAGWVATGDLSKLSWAPDGNPVFHLEDDEQVYDTESGGYQVIDSDGNVILELYAEGPPQ